MSENNIENSDRISLVNLQMDSGNFSFSVHGELQPEKMRDLVLKGLKYETERGVLSKVYQAIAGTPGKKAGSMVLPKDFERKSVLWSEENSAKFRAALEKAFGELGDFTVTVSQYVPGDSDSGMKKATELFNAAKGKGVLAQLASHPTIAYEGDLEDEDAFIAHIHAVKYAKVKPEDELGKMGF